MQPMQAPEWIGKEEVAKRLKISERTALSLVTKIKCEKRRDPESNQVVWKFHAGDVERYAFERDNPLTVVRKEGKQAEQAKLPTRNAAETPEPEVGQSEVWDTIEQAATRLCVSRARLTAAAESGRFPRTFRDLGKGTRGGQWRVLRVAKPADELF